VIPILDLKRQYESIKNEINSALYDVAESGKYILGPNVKKLEQDIAEYLDTKHTIGVASGTDALHLALMALGVGPGDEVITVSFTFVATTEAIGMVGADPVFVDINPDTFNMDVNLIEAQITDKTKAILPVHLYGQPCEMDKIMELAEKHNLYVIEDCAQAFGAEYKGKKVGSFGHCGCFSFFPSKNLGCMGDGGLVSTNSDEINDKIRCLRAHGAKVKYYHDELGVNSRLDEMQAAVLNVKFKYIDRWNEARRQAAYRYNKFFEGSEVVAPVEIDNIKAVYHQYTVKVPDRDDMQNKLKEAGIGTMIYYPVPLHKQKVHAHLKPVSLPETEKCTETVLSLPIFPELKEDEQKYIAETIINLLK